MTEQTHTEAGGLREPTDRERAIKAIRRGVRLGEVVMCSCHTNPPTRNGCFGVCEDSIAAIIASYEDIRAATRPATSEADEIEHLKNALSSPNGNGIEQLTA